MCSAHYMYTPVEPHVILWDNINGVISLVRYLRLQKLQFLFKIYEIASNFEDLTYQTTWPTEVLCWNAIQLED